MKSMIDSELAVLHQGLLEMGALCEKAIANATDLVLNQSLKCADQASDIAFEIKKKERDIEDLCLKILLRHHPVAKDLRKISSILKMITDMDRIGRQARDIADIVVHADLSKYKGNPHIQGITAATMKMVSDSLDAYVNSDIEACSAVKQYDNIVDDLFDHIKSDIIVSVLEDNTQIENGMYLLMIAKYFEKIADHATNIAHWIEFSISGKHSGKSKGKEKH